VVSRSVRDSALMLDCTAGPEPGDPYAAPPHEGSFLEAIARPPRRLRIALMLKDHRGANLHPECLEAVQQAAKLCVSLGHVVEEADPKLDMVALRPMNARISATNTARSCNTRWKALGREPNADDVEAATWAVYQRGLKVSGVEYVEAIAAVYAAGRKMAGFLTSYDVILSTTLAGPPPKLGYFDQNGDVQTFVERVTEYLSVKPLHNATATPAMSVPLHWTADGLPVGVHFAGRYGEEATLLVSGPHCAARRVQSLHRTNNGSQCRDAVEPRLRRLQLGGKRRCAERTARLADSDRPGLARLDDHAEADHGDEQEQRAFHDGVLPRKFFAGEARSDLVKFSLFPALSREQWRAGHSAII
jgi:Amidase